MILASAAEVPGPQAGDGTKCYCGLDAFHGGQIATAVLMGPREAVLVTYDARLAYAAKEAGFVVESPA